MALVAAVCPNCGAKIKVDNTTETGVCEYCGTQFITQKVINNYVKNDNFYINSESVNLESEYYRLLKSADYLLSEGEFGEACKDYKKLNNDYPYKRKEFIFNYIKAYTHNYSISHVRAYINQEPNDPQSVAARCKSTHELFLQMLKYVPQNLTYPQELRNFCEDYNEEVHRTAECELDEIRRQEHERKKAESREQARKELEKAQKEAEIRAHKRKKLLYIIPILILAITIPIIVHTFKYEIERPFWTSVIIFNIDIFIIFPIVSHFTK